MSSTPNVRFGVEIITFFNSAWWGLPPFLPGPEFAQAVRQDPRRYYDRILDGVQELGVHGVELAPAPGDFETMQNAYGSVGGIAGALAARNLQLTAGYAPGRQLVGDAMDDPDAESVADDYVRRHAAFLAELGAGVLVIGNVGRTRFKNASPDDTATPEDFSRPVDPELHRRFADQMNRLGKVAQPYGVRLAIHTDAYSVCCRDEDVCTVMSLTDPASVALCVDAGHITVDGGDAVSVLRENIDRVATMHWKDGIDEMPGHLLRGDQKQRHEIFSKYFRVLGAGKVDWKEWMRVLRDHRWSGWASAEIDSSSDPIGEIRQGLAYFREQLAPIYR